MRSLDGNDVGRCSMPARRGVAGGDPSEYVDEHAEQAALEAAVEPLLRRRSRHVMVLAS